MYYLPCIIYHVLSTMYYLPCIICHVLSAMYYLPCIIYHVLSAMYYLPCIICHVLSAMYYLSCIIYHVLSIMYYLSCIIYHVLSTSSISYQPTWINLFMPLKIEDEGCSEVMWVWTSITVSRYKPKKFSPNGTRIVSGSEEKTLKLWDAHLGQCLMSMANLPNNETASRSETDLKLLSASKEACRWVQAFAHRVAWWPGGSISLKVTVITMISGKGNWKKGHGRALIWLFDYGLVV